MAAFAMPMLIVNIQIPVHPRAIFGARRLPPTVNAAFYLQMTESTATGLEALRNGGSAPGPVKLLKTWCEHAEEDEALRGVIEDLSDVATIGVRAAAPLSPSSPTSRSRRAC